MSEATGWRHVVTIETGEEGADFEKLIGDPSINFRAQESARSPAGYRWFDFDVEANASGRESARTAWAILWALKRLHESGGLKEFRIIHGQQYLDLGDGNAAMGVDGMKPENLPG